MIYFALFFVYFLGNGAYFSGFSPYVLGNYPAESAAIFLSSQIASPAGTLLAGVTTDKTRLLRWPLFVCVSSLVVFQFLFFSVLSPLWTIVSSICLRFFLSAAGQILVIATLESGGARFARARTAGTVGFCVIQIVLYLLAETLVAHSSAEFGRWTAAFYSIGMILALFVPLKRKTHEPYYFSEAVQRMFRGSAPAFFVASFFFYLCYQLVDYYIGRFLEMRHGISAVYLGWGLSVFLEILLMPFTALLFEKFHTRSLFVLAIAAGALRFLWLGVAATSEIPAVFAQLLHGLHFAGYYAGVIFLLRRYFPAHLYGTGHALFSGFAMSCGGIAGNMLTAYMLGKSPGVSSFAIVFLGAAGIHILLIGAFYFMRLPGGAVSHSARTEAENPPAV
ncbi:MAG TPA: MFS transporter [Leptospiraceae bacterium]|nr:MFS transporter [Leptospirales bacterium]HMU83819.1 MFS transporter [Leptospiraceae bacterium]HMX57988.1 MFS transporter [Leptospiraceae bacterium]HMY45574.1 MFS transporter [Leptospiraceae bacterium]HNE23711.1 MFS transporter [Leptospiraceae bacterium]